MERIDFSTYLFRCSATGNLMTEPRDKDAKARGDLGETTKSYLKKLYREVRYNRRKEFTSKYTDKGNQVEEESITLYSRLSKRFYKKNDERVTNPFLTGHPDIYTGLTIKQAEEIADTKSSWDLDTFPFPDDPINKDYKWQLTGYMALTGAKIARLVYCLIDTLIEMILDAQKKLAWRMKVIDETPEYLEAAAEIERNMTFSDIPMEERMIEYTIERNDDDILALYKKIKKCRDYLNQLDEDYVEYFTRFSRLV